MSARVRQEPAKIMGRRCVIPAEAFYEPGGEVAGRPDLLSASRTMSIKEVCRRGVFSDATFYEWRVKFGGMEASEA